MKNVIILSCSTGQGHNSCAEAIKEYFEEKGISCEVCESLDFISPLFARFMSWGHSFMYKHIPGLFRWGYSFNEKHPGVLREGALFYRLLTLGADRMYEYLSRGGYDTVICTHVFPAIALTRMLETHPLEAVTAYVATDYTFSPGTQSSALELYFVPCASLSGAFESDIPSAHRTVASGIPVRDVFRTCHEKGEARRALQIGENHRHLLMMCGSMGCGPIVKLLRRITLEPPANLEVTVICGTNKRLRERLERKYAGNGSVHIVGYAENVSMYMDSADLYLTKPGGISVTEAAAKRLPMAFINPVSGCEKYNMDFFTDMGAAITDTSVRALAKKCVRLLDSDSELARMRRALEEYGQPNGVELIYRELSKGTKL